MNTRYTKWTGVVLTLWLVSALLLACQPIQPQSAGQASALSAEEQFIQVAMELEEAYQQKDLARVVSFYADDAISQPPGLPNDMGKEAIKVAYQALFDGYNIKRDFHLANVDISGDFATRTGEWTQVLTPIDGGEPITEVGRCVLGFKKVDGEWKVAWEIWNTFAPSTQTN
jgi:ketosteroid isomerase-like protein